MGKKNRHMVMVQGPAESSRTVEGTCGTVALCK